MYAPLPPNPGNPTYCNKEAKLRGELARSGGLTLELIRLLWLLVKGVGWLLIPPTSLTLPVAKAKA